MAERQYNYYGIYEGRAWHMVAHSGPSMMRWWMPKLMSQSDRVWCQGPQGGVRIVRHNWNIGDKFHKHGYVTRDDEAMREFAWVKLMAQQIQNPNNF